MIKSYAPIIAAAFGLAVTADRASGQEALPAIEVGAARAGAATSLGGPAQRPSPSGPGEVATNFQLPANDLESRERLDRLLPKTGANVYSLDRSAIEALPQGEQTTLDKILLQTPGVTQDSAAGGNFHIRNEHANVQYRVDGILLPDGVAGFSQILETRSIGSVSLITGALPAQYGLRTAGLVDILSRPPPAAPGGVVSLYGGSRQTGQTAFEYGARTGNWQIFAVGRLTTNTLGVDNPTPGHEAIHDRTRQGGFFGYASYAVDGATRLSFLTGTSLSKFQIPNNPGQQPQFTAFGTNWFDSANLNDNQLERNFYNVVALTHSAGDFDGQLSYFSRYSTVHFTPDHVGDLVFNGVASNVYRSSLVNGLQGDAAYRVGDGHTLRAGFIVSGEKTHVLDSSIVLPLNDDGDPIDAPFGAYDSNAKLGWIAGVYGQDEWKLTDRLTFNAGLRFDQLWQFVKANQLSPRASLVYKPVDGTTLHIGYARYFTPPTQALAAPTNLAVFNNTTQQPQISLVSPVRPERAHYFDIGVTQKLTNEFEVGLDFYYKRARNLLDDGQFGQALVQTAFNYDRAYNSGVEFKSLYQNGDFRAYANLAWARQRGSRITSNQFLFDLDELSYIGSRYIYTDHAQRWTGSAGASYVFLGTRASVDMIYGSGLRSGFANTSHLSPYTQVNLGLSREIPAPWGRPLKFRFDVVNLFDHAYVLRDGSGIGVFAPQYGPRRGFFVGLAQEF
jgi:outer membrane receptor protein involved in Fe transport